MSITANIPTAERSIEQSFISTYKGMSGHTLNGKSAALRSIRDEAISDFERLGLPGKKDEAWKYTNIRKVMDNELPSQMQPLPLTTTRDDIRDLLIPDLSGDYVVLENGGFSASASSLDNLPDGVVVTDLQTAAEEHSSVFEAHYSKYARSGDDGLVALNTAFSGKGLFIHVPAHVSIENPLQIISVRTGSEDAFLQPRMLIVVEENASLEVFERQTSKSSATAVSNRVVEAFAGKAARLTLMRYQNESTSDSQINNTFIVQENGSHVFDLTITFDGKVVRNNLTFRHLASHCETHLNGFFLCRDRMHVDNHTLVDHAMPDCYSNETYKGVLYDQSTGVFNGKVLVRQDAQRTNAYQSNKSIVMTDEAHMYSKPELEIYADDVKCSHGATTGRLDAESIFYLRSRGLSEERARALLLAAFAREVLETVSNEAIKDYLIDEMNRRVS